MSGVQDSLASVRPSLGITRVRLTTKYRLGRVTRVQAPTPHMVRVTLQGDDLRDFDSPSFDDHMKVLFPAAGMEKPVMPTQGPEGPAFADNVRPTMRDYTPRRFDRATGEVDIDFVLHGIGPATSWAARAEVGQYLGLGGPRGSMIIPPYFDWHVLIGDDTGLPAIARRLEELPDTVQAIVIVEVADPSARMDLPSRARTDVTWCYRGHDYGGAALLAALQSMPPLPGGEGYAWAATEAAVARQVRLHLTGPRGIDKTRIRAAAYWKQGAEAVHEVLAD